MIRLSVPTALLAGAAALAACERIPDNETAGGSAAGAGRQAAAGTSPAPDRPASSPGLAFPVGKWEMTTTLADISIRSDDPSARTGEQMLRQAIGKAETSTVCLDQAKIDGGLANLNKGDGSCRPVTKRIADGVIDVVMQCRSANGSTATVTHRGRYNADSLTSTVAVKASTGSGAGPAGGPALEGMDMTVRNTGRRLGDC